MDRTLDVEFKDLYCILRDYFEIKRKNDLYGTFDIEESETMEKAIQQIHQAESFVCAMEF